MTSPQPRRPLLATQLAAQLATLLGLALTPLAASADSPAPIRYQAPPAMAPVVTPAYLPATDDRVLHHAGPEFDFRQAAHTLSPAGQIASFDAKGDRHDRFATTVIENQYLKATLLPGYGGRILSLIDKRSGHEQLYRNPLGLPYAIGNGAFYYNWLQVLGGIFPTFGPEHGKSWNQPWTLEVVSESPQAITLVMRWKDSVSAWDLPDFDPPTTFTRYADASGLELRYYVTLRAGRAALDTRIEISNPGATPADYEYWTNVSFAPGSAPEAPAATAGAEIVYPLDYVFSSWCHAEPRCHKTEAQMAPVTDGPRSAIHALGTLRNYRDWSEWGIFYALDGMQNRNFWGVINHDHEEGLIRIADNQMTRGLKFWTFGHAPAQGLSDAQMRETANRPFIELWAGNALQFFSTTSLAAGATTLQGEVYAPSHGLSAITAANDNFLVELQRKGEQVVAKVQPLFPGHALRYALYQGEREIAHGEVAAKAPLPLQLSAPAQGDGAPGLTLSDPEGRVLFDSRTMASWQ